MNDENTSLDSVICLEGSTVRYALRGPLGAPTLVVCHGGALDHRGFEPLANALQDRWRVLLWDLPGHGESQPLAGRLTLERCVHALGRIVDTETLAPFTLLGFSFGGVVAQLYALERPRDVEHLLLYACFAPTLVKPAVPHWLSRFVVWSQFERPPWSLVCQRFAANCSNDPGVRAEVVHAANRLGRVHFLEFVEALVDTAHLYGPGSSWHAPTAFIYGTADSNARKFIRVERALLAAKADTRIVMLQGAGHCAHSEYPMEFVEAIGSLLDDRGLRTHALSAANRAK